MITYFPTSRPGKIFYNNMARYQVVVPYLSSRLLLAKLFGDENMIATISLPSRLDYLVGILPRLAGRVYDRINHS